MKKLLLVFALSGCAHVPQSLQPTALEVETAPMARAAESLLCISSDASGVQVLGWLATNGLLTHPAFEKLFVPARADEYLYVTHGSGHTIELNYSGLAWDTPDDPLVPPTDRLVVTSFMMLSQEQRLRALMFARLTQGIEGPVTVADSLLWRGLARNISGNAVTAWPDTCTCPSTGFWEWTSTEQAAFLDENMWLVLGIER